MNDPIEKIKTRIVDTAELSLQGESFYSAAVAIRLHAQTHHCAVCERNVAVLLRALKVWIDKPSKLLSNYAGNSVSDPERKLPQEVDPLAIFD